ncbi:hypothetical protein JD844_010555 [Phrynosoma platyrhinos]|uniref:Uncharacterized protein n=1 Tax=Phrynosoma platyrhinos TaxID=52577 RepID=A0ABQ7TGN4_PHRPL|nr:hypothetical protein JD844_010555 [Phrynosoma platyrhinos]
MGNGKRDSGYYPFVSIQAVRKGPCKGLGQLEAYLDAEEGVAFQMDNGMYWGCVNHNRVSCIEGMTEKIEACKFHIISLPSGKIGMRNWKGLCLAAMDVPSEVYFPIQPVSFEDNENQEYDVFYKNDKVTFKAYNGLFLARRRNKHNTLTAARFYPDETCYFRPVIGDVLPPTIKILGVVPDEVSDLSCTPCILAEQTYDNWKEVPVTHNFTMKWETLSVDRIIWTRMWGLGLYSSCTFQVLDTTAMIFYTPNNEQLITAVRMISEPLHQEVVVPPKKKVRAQFCVDKHNIAPLGFLAIVRKTRPDESVTFYVVGGSWKGLVFNNFRLEVEFTDL